MPDSASSGQSVRRECAVEEGEPVLALKPDPELASDNLLNRGGTFNPDQLLIQAPVKIGQAVGVDAHLG